MNLAVVLPAITTLLAAIFAVALMDQWRERRHPYQLVWAIGMSLGGPTGYAINPARDLGPRLAHALLPIAGKASSDWGYAPVPIVGPLIGSVLAALAVGAIGI